MSSSSQRCEPQLNATPLIDVLLVLLVMLIFTLPVMNHSVNVTLPQDHRYGDLAEIIVLEVDFDGVIYWNGSRVESIDLLERRLKAEQSKIPAPIISVRPDRRVRYEAAAQVLAATQRAHVRNLRIDQLADR
jgi:biopolymer transport protein ExbD